jgi:hypothetical protein
MTCPACIVQRFHSAEDWNNHPLAGHGYTREQGWSHPDLKAAVEKAKAEQVAVSNEAKS